MKTGVWLLASLFLRVLTTPSRTLQFVPRDTQPADPPLSAFLKLHTFADFFSYSRQANLYLMKFGADLKVQLLPEWRFYYLDYDGLKAVLKSSTADGKEFSEEDERKFVARLDQELEKIYSFHALKIGEIQRRVSHCEGQIKAPPTLPTTSALTRYLDIEEEINKITTEVRELASYTRLNYTGFIKILKKHDKHTCHYSLKSTFMARLNARAFFRDHIFEDLVIKLSKLYDVVRTSGRTLVSPPPSPSSLRHQPLRPVYRTHKFWVHPDNVMDVKMHVLKFRPVVVPDHPSLTSSPSGSPPISRRTTRSNSSGSIDGLSFPVEDKHHPLRRPTEIPVSSVYLDTTSLDLYAARVASRPGAEVVRLRWYGEDSRAVWVEHKVYRETGDAGVDEANATDNFTIKEKNVEKWIKGEWTVENMVRKMREKGEKDKDEINDLERVAREVQGIVTEKGLKSVLRTSYNRTTFEHPEDSSVRIELDTEIVMIREPGPVWRRGTIGAYPHLDLPGEDVYLFPYAVMEVRVRWDAAAPTDEGSGPSWVQELVGSQLVEPVAHFSKYIHGVAMLLESRASMLPFWLPQMDKDIRRTPSRRRISSAVPPSTSSANGSATSTPKTPSFNSGGGEGTPAETRPPPRQRAVIVIPGSRSVGRRESMGGREPTGRREFARRNEPTDEIILQMDETCPLLPARKAGTSTGDYFSIPPGDRRQSPPQTLHHQDESGDSSRTPRQQPIISDPNNPFAPRDPDSDNAEKLRGPLSLLTSFGRSHYSQEPMSGLPADSDIGMYLASERTFATWLCLCAVMTGFGLLLFNFNGQAEAEVVGAVLSLGAMSYAIYAWWAFQSRAGLMREMYAGPYDDRVGPTVICALLIVSVCLNFYLRFVSVVTNNGLQEPNT